MCTCVYMCIYVYMRICVENVYMCMCIYLGGLVSRDFGAPGTNIQHPNVHGGTLNSFNAIEPQYIGGDVYAQVAHVHNTVITGLERNSEKSVP